MKHEVSIHIGELYASKQPAVIHTVLGSCVAACLYDPVMQLGGMNHILLVGTSRPTAGDETARFGINAMEQLINKIVSLGGIRSRLQAKVFGGGHLLNLAEDKRPGTKNIKFVLDYLKTDGIEILSQNTGGSFSRKLYYHTDTFDIFMKQTLSKISGAKTETENIPVKIEKINSKAGEFTLFD